MSGIKIEDAAILSKQTPVHCAFCVNVSTDPEDCCHLAEQAFGSKMPHLFV